jgi:hypothetical protein
VSIGKVATIPSVAKLEAEIQKYLLETEVSKARHLRKRQARTEREAHEGEENGAAGIQASTEELSHPDDEFINFEGYSE